MTANQNEWFKQNLHDCKRSMTTREIFEPRRWKTKDLHMRKTKTQISFTVTADHLLCFRYLDSAISLLPKYKIFLPLAISNSCTAWFVSDLVRIHIVGFLTLRLIFVKLFSKQYQWNGSFWFSHFKSMKALRCHSNQPSHIIGTKQKIL